LALLLLSLSHTLSFRSLNGSRTRISPVDWLPSPPSLFHLTGRRGFCRWIRRVHVVPQDVWLASSCLPGDKSVCDLMAPGTHLKRSRSPTRCVSACFSASVTSKVPIVIVFGDCFNKQLGGPGQQIGKQAKRQSFQRTSPVPCPKEERRCVVNKVQSEDKAPSPYTVRIIWFLRHWMLGVSPAPVLSRSTRLPSQCLNGSGG
jgi:hypothetical protein